jgi:hypothetical protein
VAHGRPRAPARRARHAWARGYRDLGHGSGPAATSTPAASSPCGLHEEREGGSGVVLGKAVGGEAHRRGTSIERRLGGGETMAPRLHRRLRWAVVISG